MIIAVSLLAVHVLVGSLLSGPARITFSDLWLVMISIIASAGFFLAAWKLRARSRRLALAWAVFGLAQLMSAAGDAAFGVYEMILHASPFPSFADILYLSYYPFFLVGILLLPHERHSRLEWGMTSVDILIVLLGAALGLYAFLIAPLAQTGIEGSFLTQILSLAYPSSDLLLLFGFLIIIDRTPVRFGRGPFWLLSGGVSIAIAADILYSYQSLQGLYASGGICDWLYSASYLLLGLAGCWQGLAVDDGEGRPHVATLDSRRRAWVTYLSYLWVIAAFSLLVVNDSSRAAIPEPWLSIAVGVIIALVIIRQVINLRENQRLSGSLIAALDQVRQQALALEETNRELQRENQERRRAEERLTYDALHDALTGLPNRTLFLERLSHAARFKQRKKSYNYSVLFLDLDGFKVVNDSLGHAAGDQLLIKTAEALAGCVRSVDTVARLGGDEFVILMDDVTDREEVLKVAGRIESTLKKPFIVEGTRVFISASVGIVMDVHLAHSPADVLRDADLAMYQAKEAGKNRHVVFNPAMRTRAISRLVMENDLRRALDSGEFELHYQPIFSLPARIPTGFEALLRWNHPQRGRVMPDRFIPLAEETGLIVPLGKWVLYEACRQGREWHARFPTKPPLRIGVNISSLQLRLPDFVEEVAQVLQDTGFPGSSLTLEITESTFLGTSNLVQNMLPRLQELGIEMQIDDFGTGYSSIGYLQYQSIRSIKIDRSFIKGVDNGSVDLVRAILTLAHNLGMKAVAEGVETESQLRALEAMECTLAQGFLLSRPLDEPSATRWLVKALGGPPRSRFSTGPLYRSSLKHE